MIFYTVFIEKQPGGPGWKKIVDKVQTGEIEIFVGSKKLPVPSGILAMIIECVLVYGCMFATGNWIYGIYSVAIGLSIVVVISGFLLARVWNHMKKDIL